MLLTARFGLDVVMVWMVMGRNVVMKWSERDGWCWFLLDCGDKIGHTHTYIREGRKYKREAW